MLPPRVTRPPPPPPPRGGGPPARRYLARPGHELTAERQDEIASETMRVLTDPRFARLFGPNSRAEVEVVGLVTGRALSGRVDRLVIEDDAVWIVDYKTNRPPPVRAEDVPPVYVRQMEAYRAALRAIYPDKAVRCVLLWTDTPALMELPE
nr:PD-(D/E)XK nuclease family protein [Azospirillum formosense]